MKATTNSTFIKDVLESKKTVLLDVWAPWCPPCRGMAPILDVLSEEIKDWAEIVKVDASVEEELAHRLGVTGLPTFMVFKDGQVVGSHIGATSKAKLLELVSK